MTKTRKIEATPTLFEERIKTVENAVNSKDWFTAFTSIVTYYEYYAYWAIRNQCTSARAKLNKKAEDSLKRLGAANLALLLRIMDIIDNEEYSTIKRTIAESARARANGNIKLKTIALPVNIEYEPWIYDILKHVQRNKGKLAFDMTRQHLRILLRKALKDIIPPTNKHNCKNILRHWRLSHLTEYYMFDPLQLSNYSGWSVQNAFAQAGMPIGSQNIDKYVKTVWHSYFPKLLRPIDQLTN